MISRATTANAHSGRNKASNRCRRAANHAEASNAAAAQGQKAPGGAAIRADSTGCAASRAVVITLTVNAVADDPPRLTDAGLTAQVASCGAPEQERATVPLNPATGASARL